MKRFALIASFALALMVAIFASAPRADAAKHAAPSPSPSPSAAPTATPEPPEVAIPRLQAVLKANPNDQQAMADLAQQYLQIGQPQAAGQITQHLLQIGNRSLQVFAVDGEVMESLGNVPGAITDFEQARNIDATNMGLITSLTTLYVRANRFPDAERLAIKAVTLNKTDPLAYTNLGVVYANEKKYDDARAQFQQAATLDPKSTDPLVQIAKTYAAQNNVPSALKSVDDALAIDPKNVQILVFKAQLYGQEHDDTNVENAYQDAVVAATSDEQKVAILIAKAQYYAGEKKNDRAGQIISATVAQYPKSPQAHVAAGDLAASNHQNAQAIQEWNTALGIDKDYSPALIRLGQASLATGKNSDAIGYLKRYTQVNPDAQGFALLGQAYAMTRDYSHARAACSQSFDIQRAPASLACIGGADYQMKNYAEAARVFDVLDRGAPDFFSQNPQLLYIAGKTYENTHQKTKAIAMYKQLLGFVKKGTPMHNQIQQSINSLSNHSKRA